MLTVLAVRAKIASKVTETSVWIQLQRAARGVSHKPGGGLPLLSAWPAVTPATLKTAATNFSAW